MIRSISLQRTSLRPLGVGNALRGCLAPICRAQSRVITPLVCRDQLVTRASSATAAPKPPGPKFPIAQRMIIYHIGTPRIMFLGALKLTTIFVFGFFAVVVIPACVGADLPLWKTAGVAAAGVVPFLAVWYLTSPMVVWIHMRVPDKYRRSTHALQQFLDAPPADAEVTITNMGALFKPRVSLVRISELRAESKRFGLVNYTRDTARENSQRKWWMFRAMGGFRIEDETTTGSKSKTPWIWYTVAKQIRQRARGQKKARRS